MEMEVSASTRVEVPVLGRVGDFLGGLVLEHRVATVSRITQGRLITSALEQPEVYRRLAMPFGDPERRGNLSSEVGSRWELVLVEAALVEEVLHLLQGYGNFTKTHGGCCRDYFSLWARSAGTYPY